MDEQGLKEYIEKTWQGKFEVKIKVPLKDLFSEPEGKGLKRLWKAGHADVAVFRNGKLLAVLEPGGAHHFEEKQSLSDRRKYMLCKLNGVNCLFFIANVPEKLSRRKFRNMIRRVLFGSSG